MDLILGKCVPTESRDIPENSSFIYNPTFKALDEARDPALSEKVRAFRKLNPSKQ